MTHMQALELVGDLPPRHTASLFDEAAVIDTLGLPRGLWLGRTCGGARAYKWLVRKVVRRDYFAKILVDDWGANLRLQQDGSFATRLNAQGAPRVDLPFCLNWDTLDYGYHVLGQDFAQPPLMFRDEMRAVPIAELHERVPRSEIERLGLSVGEAALTPRGEGLLLIGYIVPFGIHRLRGTPFGMVFHRRSKPSEIDAARRHVARVRVLDSSPGPCRVRAHQPSTIPIPS